MARRLTFVLRVHKQIHTLFDHTHLAKELNTIDKLKSDAHGCASKIILNESKSPEKKDRYYDRTQLTIPMFQGYL